MKPFIHRAIRYIFHGIPVKDIRAEIHYLSPNKTLENKKIIITGGSRGIGFAMAKRFVSEGAHVLIAGRNEKTLEESAKKLGCYYLKLDVQNTDSFKPFIQEAYALLGGIDCLVNNAGISLHENTFFDVTPSTFDAQVSTNFKGAFFLTQEVVSLMIGRKQKGEILFVSSETGDTMDIRPYGLTKTAVNSLVQGLAYLLSRHGIRVNAVAPGITTSDMTGYKPDDNLYCSVNATERVYLPEEVAETAAFLLSDASGCISGQIITCNNAKTVNARWK